MYTGRKESNSSHLGEKLPQISTTHVIDTGEKAEWNMVLQLRRCEVIPGTEGEWLTEMKFTVVTNGTWRHSDLPQHPSKKKTA